MFPNAPWLCLGLALTFCAPLQGVRQSRTQDEETWGSWFMEKGWKTMVLTIYEAILNLLAFRQRSEKLKRRWLITPAPKKVEE